MKKIIISNFEERNGNSARQNINIAISWTAVKMVNDEESARSVSSLASRLHNIFSHANDAPLAASNSLESVEPATPILTFAPGCEWLHITLASTALHKPSTRLRSFLDVHCKEVGQIDRLYPLKPAVSTAADDVEVVMSQLSLPNDETNADDTEANAAVEGAGDQPVRRRHSASKLTRNESPQQQQQQQQQCSSDLQSGARDSVIGGEHAEGSNPERSDRKHKTREPSPRSKFFAVMMLNAKP